MEIKIKLTRAEVNHLKPYHTFYDACEYENDVMRKVQRAIVKELIKQKKKIEK